MRPPDNRKTLLRYQGSSLCRLPVSGKIFISVRQSDKPHAVEIARNLAELGFTLYATRGTAAAITEAGIDVIIVNKVAEGRPHIVDMIKNGEINLIINTVKNQSSAIKDSYSIRRAALQGKVTYYTTLAGARAACVGITNRRELQAYNLQKLHVQLKA